MIRCTVIHHGRNPKLQRHLSGRLRTALSVHKVPFVSIMTQNELTREYLEAMATTVGSVFCIEGATETAKIAAQVAANAQVFTPVLIRAARPRFLDEVVRAAEAAGNVNIEQLRSRVRVIGMPTGDRTYIDTWSDEVMAVIKALRE